MWELPAERRSAEASWDYRGRWELWFPVAVDEKRITEQQRSAEASRDYRGRREFVEQFSRSRRNCPTGRFSFKARGSKLWNCSKLLRSVGL
ncbi:hypothetical protein NDU88_005111 [Pleurodeles waltl]|uniref:Uncharacterized protein n=1 Tax=Pleurodeles waltl TaxID=8319 RepID=A0AAV7TBA5_PLEWA|nr:hypothetical protein NDU88_005111 [Pleurodeles waltl]